MRLLVLGGNEVPRPRGRRGGARSRARADALQSRRDEPGVVPRGRAPARRPDRRPRTRSRGGAGTRRSTSTRRSCRGTRAAGPRRSRRRRALRLRLDDLRLRRPVAADSTRSRPSSSRRIREPEAFDPELLRRAQGRLRTDGAGGLRRRAPRSSRPGLIAGPARPDRPLHVLAAPPGGGRERARAGRPPAAPVQLVDARDLGAWLVRLAERGTGGVFNAPAPSGR